MIEKEMLTAANFTFLTAIPFYSIITQLGQQFVNHMTSITESSK